MIGVNRIDHINMKVRDLAASKAFYGRVFGFEAKDEGISGGRPWAVLGTQGKAYLCLYEVPDLALGGDAQRISHFGFHVADFATVQEGLAALGVRVRYGGAVDYGASRSLYIEDPSGHEIELSEAAGGGLG